MATQDGQAYIDHPLLTSKTVERRLYQLRLANRALENHTLVCLPTGLGKTTVSLLVTVRRLEEVGGKILLLAPTKPLVQQHATFYREALRMDEDDVVVFTGDVRPDDREELWTTSQIVIATPQVIENDLIGGRISLQSVTHCTFDECHRATGDYAYTYIAERYHEDADQPLVTGMSASPGSDKDEIVTICSNLGIKSVDVMTEDDADVDSYTHATEIDWEQVTLPDDLADIRDLLVDVIKQRLGTLRELGITNRSDPDLSQKDLNKLRGKIQELIDNDNSAGYQAMSIHAEIMKIRRARELIETQSVEALERYFDRQQQAARSSGASKASQRFISDGKILEAIRRVEDFDGRHPKFERARARLAETLGIDGGDRAIVFTESRDTAEVLTEILGESFDTHRFVGQGDKEHSDGMTQKEQQETLDAFRAGDFEVLVSTSVAEEGLDVPEVDLVLFYEPVPTAIRSIQRKGRTGRQAKGAVVVLMTEDTRDEAFFWMSRRREQKMQEELRELKSMTDELNSELSQANLTNFSSGDRPDSSSVSNNTGSKSTNADSGQSQATLQQTISSVTEQSDNADSASSDDTPVPATDELEVVVDQRELHSTVARQLSKRSDIQTRLETLSVGDYICSDRVAVERKTVDDFLDTLLGEERSLFEQASDLTRHYPRSVFLIEGDNLYEKRDVHPNAIRGSLTSLAVDFGVSVLFSSDEDDTTKIISTIATREQEHNDRTISVHGEKQAKTLSEQQEYVVASIAEIGPVTARSLLSEFGSVEAVMTADKQTLMEAEGVGEVTAERIRDVVGSQYQ